MEEKLKQQELSDHGNDGRTSLQRSCWIELKLVPLCNDVCRIFFIGYYGTATILLVKLLLAYGLRPVPDVLLSHF